MKAEFYIQPPSSSPTRSTKRERGMEEERRKQGTTEKERLVGERGKLQGSSRTSLAMAAFSSAAACACAADVAKTCGG
jgi:hypothetical protein